MCRATVLRTLGTNNDLETIQEAKKRFNAHLNGTLIPADLRSAVYASVLVDADLATVNKFIELHDSCDLQEEKMRLAGALGSVTKEELIQKVLDFALSVRTRLETLTFVCSSASFNIPFNSIAISETPGLRERDCGRIRQHDFQVGLGLDLAIRQEELVNHLRPILVRLPDHQALQGKKDSR